ncbi:hypothetical protein [Psychromonas aquimarina]|uniref:hypothetical protein n=1 Tax=Psychromonas aquimarina TaxID=444919 RepID=UPI00048F8EFC|nr:hypothetical protein [Psychromonas aquimarina]
MSLWMVILLSFAQISFGGAVGMGGIFYACAEHTHNTSNFANNVLVGLWFIYCISLLVSAGILIYGYRIDGTTSFYWWLLMPWSVLSLMLFYWKLSALRTA